MFNSGPWKPVVVPGAAILIFAALALHSEMLAISAALVTSYYYAVFAAGLLLSLRFGSTRVFFSLVSLMLAHRALEFFSGSSLGPVGPGRAAFNMAALLLPLSFLAFSWMRERGFKAAGIAPRLSLLLVESAMVTLACRPGASSLQWLFGSTPVITPHSTGVPRIAWLAMIVTSLTLVIRYLRMHKPVETGFLWSLTSVGISMHFGGTTRLADGYMATAGLILAASVVETSYIMAYHDELTGLPGRRAFNETLASLDGPYALAIVDIDHFKKFNDTYGHDTGDEVLRMVASRLGRVSGGGKAFRCGGEEFAILFQSKSAPDAAEHLELLRQQIEISAFQLRGGRERRQTPREPSIERRKTAERQAKPRTTPTTGWLQELFVTVSIGVAEPSARLREVDQVIKAADKALYRAKAAGRNRIELASVSRPHPVRAKKASA